MADQALARIPEDVRLVPVADVQSSGPDLSRADAYADLAFADNTRLAYRGDWRRFAGWCAHVGAEPLPALSATVSAYLAHLADTGNKPSTIGRAMAAIVKAHGARGLPNPAAHAYVKATWAGIRNKKGVATVKKAPIGLKTIGEAFDVLGTDLHGIRDRALLALGYTGAFRRNELVKLRMERVDFVEQGLLINVGKDKTNQTGEDRYKGILRGKRKATCPVLCLRKWLDLSGIREGFVFQAINPAGKLSGEALCDRTVALRVKTVAAAAGLDPKRFAGHSLRSGLITDAYRNGASMKAIMDQAGHKQIQTTVGYVRSVSVFEDNATKGLY